ncbi:MAG: hypothetical protein COA73_13445 [Candidatus Hydrogenedentota bacterium]|nr:MAG: hypothetical protein COA73_13445 [Candidatus Hydrogenedentota bacterium]
MKVVTFLFCMGALLLPSISYGQFGINTRSSNTTLLIDEVPPSTAGSMQVQSAFPALSGQFPSLMGVMEAPDGSGRLFVMLRSGVIRTFPKAAATLGNLTTFMDISGSVIENFESGLLGMAFHPNYASNGEVYLHYTRSGPISVIARFTNDNPADNTLSSATEDIILELPQPANNHNGGTIAFGPDGMLYIAFGDGGGSDASRANGQDTTNLLGSVLRIDVDSTPSNPGVQNYVIPSDNPFFGGTGPSPSTREEIYAYGFRNPYRFSFDIQNGTMYLGDVGEVLREEINVVVSGGNYGWPIMEGSICFNATNEGVPLPSCDQTGLILPIDERIYGSSESIAVLGGYTYYGSEVPELFGYYIYADFVTGNIWGLLYNGTSVTDQRLLANVPGLTLFSLGQDASGEVYLCNNSTNELLVLRPVVPSGPSTFPTLLSDIPALLAAGSGTDQTANGIIPYFPSSQLWSDGAFKERFMAIPGLDQVGYTNTGGWNFPADTVLIKNFVLPLDFRNPIATGKRIETRLLVRNGGNWHGFSYEWNDAETDATLLASGKDRAFNLIDENGVPFNYTWNYPSRNECFQCHTVAANRVLGLNTAQMNNDFLYPASGITDNQMETLDNINLFTAPLPDIPANLPRSPDAFAAGSASVQDRSLSYLKANCAMCHQPGGTAPTNVDLRWGIPLSQRTLINANPFAGNLGIPNAKVIAPGDPGRSIVLQRILNLGIHRMPPIGSSRVHPEAVSLITQWINDASDFYVVVAEDDAVCLSLPAGFPVSGSTTYQWFKRPDLGTVISTSADLCFASAQLSDIGEYVLLYDDGTRAPAQYEVTLIVSAALPGLDYRYSVLLIGLVLLCGSMAVKRIKI